jgi:hypothetical protein
MIIEIVVNSSKLKPMKTLMCGAKGTDTNKQADMSNNNNKDKEAR